MNYRKNLWTAEEAQATMIPMMKHVDISIGNEEDASDVLGIAAEGTEVEAGEINAEGYIAVAKEIVSQFPNVRNVAITLRESISASHNNWGGMLHDVASDAAHFAPLDADGNYVPYEIRSIVDRVGGGDSFGAGLIHALTGDEYNEPDMAIRFAVAASCLKHSIKGDFSFTTRDEIVALVGGAASGRVRR